MKLTCVGLGPARCLILRYRKVNILLDCGLCIDSSFLARESNACQDHQRLHEAYLGPFLQLPRLTDLHAALITTPEALLGLPLLLRQNPEAILGPMYCTLAALDVALHLAQELLDPQHRQATAQTRVSTAQPADHQAGQPTGWRHGAGPGGLPAAGTVPSPEEAGWGLLAHLAPDARMRLYEACWQHGLPSMEEVRACLSKVKAVRYGEHVVLDSHYLSAVAYPSGSGAGAALWVISDGTNYLAYASDLSLQPGHFLELQPGTLAGLSALVLGPRCLAQQAAPAPTSPAAHAQQAAHPQQAVHVAQAVQGQQAAHPQQAGHVQQATQGQQAPHMHRAAHPAAAAAAAGPLGRPLGPQQQLPGGPPVLNPRVQQACKLAVQAVQAGGCVLVPVHATGCAWELVEGLAASMEAAGGVAASTPLLYVGPSARDSLALAGTCMEFLSSARQARAYVPEATFPFDALQASGRLRVAARLSDPSLLRGWREPAVVLVPAASLSTGPFAQLLRKWGPDPRACLLLDPALLGPHPQRAVSRPRACQGGHLAMQVVLAGCAVPRPSAPQLAKLLDAVRPRFLLLHEEDHAALRSLPPGSRGVFARDGVVPYQWLQQVRVELGTQAALPTCSLPTRVLQGLRWQEVGNPRLAAARLTCLMTHKRGGWRLEPLPSGVTSSPAGIAAGVAAHMSGAAREHQLLWGRPSLTGLLQALQDRGLGDVQVLTQQQPVQHQQQQDSVAGGAPAVEVVSVIRFGQVEAEIRLGVSMAEVRASSAVVRSVLASCIATQLHSL